MANRFTVTARSVFAAVAMGALISDSIISVHAVSLYETLPIFTAAVEKAKPPKGWAQFCARYPSECNAKSTAPRDVVLTPDIWEAIVGANKWANENIKPTTDMKHWGKVDKWDYPDDGRGDCEDYVLLKRRILMEAGLPRAALLITIVWTKKNKGHTVLIVRTDKGDLVLDNLSSKVLLWSGTNYDFVKQQSQIDPNAWVYIDSYLRKQSITVSVKKGEALAANGVGNSATRCATCHGPGLNGMGAIPGLAGLSPNYIVRQLYDLKHGLRADISSELMKPVAEALTIEDMIVLAA